MKHKHSTSFRFASIFLPVLNDPRQVAHPVLEDGLDAIKSEITPTLGISSLISSLELNS
jgi:hypothetical protein